MIYGLKWHHPAIILFVLNVVLGGWGLYLERVLMPEVVSVATRGLPWPLLHVAALYAAWGPLYMVARPYDLLPQRSLSIHEKVFLRRETLVQRVGYVLGLLLFSFGLYRFSQMLLA